MYHSGMFCLVAKHLYLNRVNAMRVGELLSHALTVAARSQNEDGSSVPRLVPDEDTRTLGRVHVRLPVCALRECIRARVHTRKCLVSVIASPLLSSFWFVPSQYHHNSFPLLFLFLSLSHTLSCH